MLENAADSQPSSARFVGLRNVVPDSLAVKDLPAKRLTKLLHELLTLAYERLKKKLKKIQTQLQTDTQSRLEDTFIDFTVPAT